jgi:hypothetical protein
MTRTASWILLALTLIGGLAAARSECLPDDRTAAHGITIYYTAEQEGFVTLVVEDAQGNRVKNLVLDYPVHKGGMFVEWDWRARRVLYQ